MSVYNIHSQALQAIYSTQSSLNAAYDIAGNKVFGDSSQPDYDEWSTEFQHAILIARDEWAAEYRSDPTVIPLVLTTDQHGTLSTTYAKDLFKYLALAVKWDECSACVNLGDTVASSYNETTLRAMVSTLSPIPRNKQILVLGNHDTWGDWIKDAEQMSPSEQHWSNLLAFFDNSPCAGYLRRGTHQTAECVIDQSRNVKYVIAGGWDYNKQLGGHSHYLIDSDNLQGLIDILSENDGYDIVLLSHIQPFAGRQRYNHDAWRMPAVDGRDEAVMRDVAVEPYVNTKETRLNDLFNARKEKTSGTVNDSYGNAHSFDFSNCTGDLICTLHGHWHVDYFNWFGINNDIPTVLYDALHFDHKPFYFVNINRTAERITSWKITDDAMIQKIVIPFNESDDTTKYLSSITAVYTGGSVPYGTALNELTGITVTRTYADGTTAALSSGWTLSGTLDVGDNTITLTYISLTATFTVTVVEAT